jgi:hypothetical protein
MSEYFRVLKRIERDQREGEPRRPAVQKAARDPEPPSAAVTGLSLQAISPAAAPTPPGGAFATLFDNLRAANGGQPLRCLVFAGVSASEPAQAVTAGLAAHVEGRGLDVLRAELTEAAGRALIRRHRQELSDGGEPVHLDLQARDWDSDFSAWLRARVGSPDLVLIEGRPLVQSIDAALLACACDGLVLVAQTEATQRDALQTATQRARAAGCRTLGLVMYGTVDRMPRWLRRVIADVRRPRPESQE